MDTNLWRTTSEVTRGGGSTRAGTVTRSLLTLMPNSWANLSSAYLLCRTIYAAHKKISHYKWYPAEIIIILINSRGIRDQKSTSRMLCSLSWGRLQVALSMLVTCLSLSFLEYLCPSKILQTYNHFFIKRMSMTWIIQIYWMIMDTVPP